MRDSEGVMVRDSEGGDEVEVSDHIHQYMSNAPSSPIICTGLPLETAFEV